MSTDQQQLAKLGLIRNHIAAGNALLEKPFDKETAEMWFRKCKPLNKDVELNKADPVFDTLGKGLTMLARILETRWRQEQPDAEATSGDLTSSQEADDERSGSEVDLSHSATK